MTATWDKMKIASLLCSAFAPDIARQRAENEAGPTANIDVLVTFDEGGVSSHPNHISLYHGAKAFVEGIVAGKEGWSSPVDLYTLTSVNILRKYTSVMDIYTTLASWKLDGDLSDATHPGGLLFMSSVYGENAYGTAWKAMTEAHKSQMVWFRYLWISFSRYMLINDLRLVKAEEKR